MILLNKFPENHKISEALRKAVDQIRLAVWWTSRTRSPCFKNKI